VFAFFILSLIQTTHCDNYILRSLISILIPIVYANKHKAVALNKIQPQYYRIYDFPTANDNCHAFYAAKLLYFQKTCPLRSGTQRNRNKNDQVVTTITDDKITETHGIVWRELRDNKMTRQW